jgi:hypothetical protein
MELNFGEAFQQKHIIILDTKTLETKYVVNDFSPKHLIIKESQIEAYDLEGNFVQILVEDIASTNIVDVRKQILSNNKNVTLEFKENKKEKGVENISTKDKFDFADGEILERYVSVSNKELDPIKLLAIGKEICQNV